MDSTSSGRRWSEPGNSIARKTSPRTDKGGSIRSSGARPIAYLIIDSGGHLLRSSCGETATVSGRNHTLRPRRK